MEIDLVRLIERYDSFSKHYNIQEERCPFQKVHGFPKLKNFIAIDFETANHKNNPCQLGITIVNDGVIIETLSFLIRPKDNVYDERNIKVHHITPDQTADAPEFPEIWKSIKQYFENAYVIAHNAPFDIKTVLYQTLKDYNLPYPSIRGYLCTCELNNNERLEIACARYDIKLSNHHNGGDDALNCAKLYLAYVEDKCRLKDDDIPKEIFLCSDSKKHHSSFEGHERISGDVLKQNLEGADPNNPFYNRKVVISGIFDNFDRNELAARLKTMGADVDSSVSKKTNFLITGIDAGPKKLEQMKQLIANGKPARILNEEDIKKIFDGLDYNLYKL